MKFFLLFLPITIIFSACSSKNAFEYFYMSKKQEITQENIQSVKLEDGDKVVGICNIVYLNNIMPEKYNTKEYFYIYMFSDDNYKELTFYLQKNKPVYIKALPKDNKFQTLTKESYKWQKYYLVEFKKVEDIKLVFDIKNRSTISKKLIFEKIEY